MCKGFYAFALSFESNTVEHDFNGHVINGIHEVNGNKCCCRAFHLVNKLYDFTGMLDLSGNFCYDNFSVKVMHDCTLIFLQFHPYREHAVQRVGAFL